MSCAWPLVNSPGQLIGRFNNSLFIGTFGRVSDTQPQDSAVWANFLAESREAVFGRASIV